jgi:hypothetical protein
MAGLVLFAMLVIPLQSLAQSTRGELAGNVADPSGAVIVGAQVTAVGVDTGVKYQAVTTSSGSYRFPEIAIGRYNVTVTSTGFSASVSRGVLININSTSALNVVLQPGAATESISVDASAPTVESESSELGGTISSQQIQDLPLLIANGVGGLRSPEAFAFLVPGTTGPGSGGTGLNANGVWFMKLGGGQSFGSDTLLDGASIQRSENGSSFDETSPSIEAMQELKVTTSTPPAEFGRTTGGTESFSTKSGTNSFHGTGFAIVRNAVFDANDWFRNGDLKYYASSETAATLKANYGRQQDSKFDYGGTFSGPVRIPNPFNRNKDLYNGKDKTFFFFAWEQFRLRLGSSTTSTVPTDDEKKGDFSALLTLQGAVSPTAYTNPCTGDIINQNQIFDPATETTVGGTPCRTPFANNQVPLRSSAAKALIKGLPSPNQTAAVNTAGYYNNYVQNSVDPTQNTTYTIRIDHDFSLKSKLFGSYDSRDNWRELGYANLPVPYNNAGYLQDFETHYGRAGWDYTFTPTLLNHLNLGFDRTNSVNFSSGINNSNNLTADGAPNYYSNAFPLVNFYDDPYSSWGVGNNGDNIDNGIRVNDSVNWQKGRHNFKFGVDWTHQQYSVIQDSIPTVNFIRWETMAAPGGAGTAAGNALASLELGAVDWSAQTIYNHNPRWNSHYVAGFFQDDIKLTPSLTINVGLRYDLDAPRHEADNDTSNFSFTATDSVTGLPGALEFGKTCKNCNGGAWADTWKKDWGPRVGFSYLLPGSNGKTVLRGGGGILYGPLQYDDFGGSMTLGYTQTRNWGSNGWSGASNDFTPAFSLDTGYAPWTKSYFAPVTNASQLSSGIAGDFESVGGELIQKKNGRPAMVSEWSLQLQHELAQDLIFTLGYIGQVGQNLRSGDLSNANNGSSSYFSYGDHLTNWADDVPLGGSHTFTPQGSSTPVTVKAPFTNFNGTVGQALRPYPQYDYIAGDCCLENLGHSSYEAMVATLNRRFRQGFNLQVSYTWSKNLNDADSSNTWNYSSYRTQAQNSSDRKGEKAVSLQNLPQQISISYLYQLPFGKGRTWLNRSGVLDRVVGGWELGGIQRYSSGQPVDFGCGSGWMSLYENCFRYSRGNAGASGLASAAYKKNKNGPNFFNQQSWFKQAYRPAKEYSTTDPGVSLQNAGFVDENSEGYGTYSGGTTQWIRPLSADCAAGAYLCSYAPFVFGSGIPRVTEEVTGPIYKAEDFSLLKNFAITEKVKFVFKAEVNDAFNRHRFAMPDVAPGDYCESTTGCTGFGIPTSVDYGPRNIQVSGRITF